MPADTMRQNGCDVLVLHIGQQCWWVFAYACVCMYLHLTAALAMTTRGAQQRQSAAKVERFEL